MQRALFQLCHFRQAMAWPSESPDGVTPGQNTEQETIVRTWRTLIGIAILFAGCASYAERKTDSDRYVKKFKLLTGEAIVVAEGDFEPRSLGSYSVRVYDATPNFSTDFFLCGVIREGDGYIEKVSIKDIDGDGAQEIVVIIRCVGTGGYLSADAFRYARPSKRHAKQLKLIASVSGLAKDADPIHALARAQMSDIPRAPGTLRSGARQNAEKGHADV